MTKTDEMTLFDILNKKKNTGDPAMVLAPMAGFTDAAFRRICAEMGCDMSVSEMISAKAMVYRDKKTAGLARIVSGEAPAAIQLFGHEPSVMGEAANMIVNGSFEGCDFAHPPVAVDINMGCPVKKIFTSGDGSALMKDPELCMQIVSETKKGAGDVPVTVKIRAGVTKDTKNAVEVALACAEGGAAAVCVHGRTREQMYAPGVDLDIISRVREALPREIYVIGNGDVDSRESARHMADYTGCGAVMVGRAALGNPWLFGESKPTVEERLSCAYRLICEIVKEKGEFAGVRESRGRAAHFIRGLRGAAEMRSALNSAETLEEIKEILAYGSIE